VCRLVWRPTQPALTVPCRWSRCKFEMAKVAAVSCIHNCIQTVCGGDEKMGDGCRFDFPKKNLPHTVPAVMQVNATLRIWDSFHDHDPSVGVQRPKFGIQFHYSNVKVRWQHSRLLIGYSVLPSGGICSTEVCALRVLLAGDLCLC